MIYQWWVRSAALYIGKDRERSAIDYMLYWHWKQKIKQVRKPKRTLLSHRRR